MVRRGDSNKFDKDMIFSDINIYKTQTKSVIYQKFTLINMLGIVGSASEFGA